MIHTLIIVNSSPDGQPTVSSTVAVALPPGVAGIAVIVTLPSVGRGVFFVNNNGVPTPSAVAVTDEPVYDSAILTDAPDS